MTNLYHAHRQWLERPPDERFASIPALYDYVKARREHAEEELRSPHDLKIDVSPEGAIALNGLHPPAYLTHWSFGQLCSLAGAPAKYLRSLSLDLVRDCLGQGLRKASGSCKLLYRDGPYLEDSLIQPVAAALTGPKYGRIWDADILESLTAALLGTSWHTPPAHPNHGSEAAGLYASDRDMFVFLVNDEDPIEVGNAKLGRGFFLWNSETGSASFGLTTFLYNFVCSNHIVWGAEEVKELRLVHRQSAPDRFCREALPLLNRYVEDRQVSRKVTEVVSHAMADRIGQTPDDVRQWLSSRDFTKTQTEAVIEIGRQEEEDVTTRWGVVQGLTAYARQIPHINERVALERQAGALLQKD